MADSPLPIARFLLAVFLFFCAGSAWLVLRHLITMWVVMVTWNAAARLVRWLSRGRFDWTIRAGAGDMVDSLEASTERQPDLLDAIVLVPVGIVCVAASGWLIGR